jgi:hypothetical protein
MGVQDAKQLGKTRREIAAVFARSQLDEVLELPPFKYAGIIAEKTEQQADQIDFQIVRGVGESKKLEDQRLRVAHRTDSVIKK